MSGLGGDLLECPLLAGSGPSHRDQTRLANQIANQRVRIGREWPGPMEMLEVEKP